MFICTMDATAQSDEIEAAVSNSSSRYHQCNDDSSNTFSMFVTLNLFVEYEQE